MSVINLAGGQLSATQQFQLQPGDISGVTELGQLKDVDVTGVANNSIIKYNSTSGNWEIAVDTDTGITDVVQDTTPELGGPLSVNGQKITSASNGNIDIEPNGTGNVLLGNFTFDADQSVGSGQDNFVLTYDNSTGLISLEASSAASTGADFIPDTDNTHDIGEGPVITGGKKAWKDLFLRNEIQIGGASNNVTYGVGGIAVGSFTDNVADFAISADGLITVSRGEDDSHSVVLDIEKKVGSGGDLSRRVSQIARINDGTTNKRLGITNWQDDSTAGKKYQIGYLADDGSSTTILQNWSENSGSTINVPLTLDHTNNSNNATDLMLKKTTTRTLSQNQPGVNLDFRTEYSGTTTPQHQIKSRRFGSENNKQLQFFDVNDAGTAATKLVQFKKNSAWTSTNNHVEMQMNGRIDLNILNADDMPNSNITKVNMDGTTTSSHNMLTGKMDFGSSSIANASQVTLTAEAFNDAGGGESSPDRIGQLIFKYGTDEKNNAIELRVANHDLSTQSNIQVDGEQAGSSVPFKVPAYTVANLPTSGIGQGAMAIVTNANSSDVSTGIAHCFYDGANWKYTHLPATTVRT